MYLQFLPIESQLGLHYLSNDTAIFGSKLPETLDVIINF